MNEVMKNILTRRSVRKFTEDPIPADVLKDIVDAALHAPSAIGKQTWKFTVITNKDVIARLAAVIEKAANRPGYDTYRPTVVILPTNAKETKYGCDDNACALENIFLAAHSYGVGSVWINQLRDVCEVPEVRKLLTELGVPADHTAYGIAALGYAAPDAPVRDIKRIGEVAYIE